jgi:hypothetical protein
MQREGQISIWKESISLIGTYSLKSIEGGINQHIERKQVIKGHLQAGEHKGRDRSANEKEVSY